MALGVIHDQAGRRAAFYDTVTGVAFGEVFEGDDAWEQAQHFAYWLSRELPPVDPRDLTLEALSEQRSKWREQHYNAELGMLTDEAHEELMRRGV